MSYSRIIVDYPLHPSALKQLEKLEPASASAGESASMLRACAAVLAALRLDTMQDAATLAAPEAAQPSIVQTSFLRHANAAVRRLNPVCDVCERAVHTSWCWLVAA